MLGGENGGGQRGVSSTINYIMVDNAADNPGGGPPQEILSVRTSGDRELVSLGELGAIPEEALWLANFTSPHTRSAYKTSVSAFVKWAGLRSGKDFALVGRAAVIAWRDSLVKEGSSIRTVKLRLSALSSLLSHLVLHGLVERNVVAEVKPPKLESRTGETLALSREEARKVLDAPPPQTLRGLRDRAILAVGFQVGARRDEIAKLRVEDFFQDRGFACLKLKRKGGAHGAVAIHEDVSRRIREYLDSSGHGEERSGPLFRRVKSNRNLKAASDSQHLTPWAVGWVVKYWLKRSGLNACDYSAHSMRATCATTALDNGASLEAVQELLGHANPSTTKLYDRRGYNPERSASRFAVY